MPAEITIRPATPADNILLAELGARTFFDTFAPDNTPEDMAAYLAASFSPEIQAQKLADPATTFLIAEIDQTPVGYTQLRLGAPPVSDSGQRPIEIVRIYADKAWLGQGVGAALMSAGLTLARQNNCDTIWLDVWEKNPRAIAFYQKWGFAVVGLQPFQLGNDLQQDLIMLRPVD